MRLTLLLLISASIAVAGEPASPPCVNCTPMTVSVRAAKGVGNRATIPDSIINFAFSPATISIALGDTVTWTNTGSATHTTTSDTGIWDSGFLSINNTFSFTFNSYGRFPFHCNVHSSMTAAVVVAPPPPTTGSNSPIKAGSTLNLTSSSSVGGVTFSWTGPNSFTASVQNPSIPSATGAATGTYTCTTTINGATSSATVDVVVVDPPTTGNNGPLCEGQTLNLTASTIPGATYAWTGPNGFTASVQNPSKSNVTQNDAGTYSVTATVGAITSDPATTSVSINTVPAAPAASSNSPLTEGQTLNLTATTIPGAAYSWSGPGGFTSTQQSPSIANAPSSGSGSYSVTVTVNNCTSATATTSVSITDVAPVLNSGPSASPAAPEVAQSVQFSAAFTDTDALTIAWDFGDGQIGSGADVTHAFQPAGDYHVTVTATDTGKLTASGSLDITVTPKTLPGLGGVAAAHQDSDGDGFSDEIELAAGTSASSAADTPFAGAPAGTTQTPSAIKMAIGLNFAKDNLDSISVSGAIAVPAGFSADQKSVVVDVGGVVKTFKLNSKGMVKLGNDTFKLVVKTKNKQVPAQDAKFSAKFSKGSFKSKLADYGLTGEADVKNQSENINLSLLLTTGGLQGVVPQSYTAKQGKTGKTKNPK